MNRYYEIGLRVGAEAAPQDPYTDLDIATSTKTASNADTPAVDIARKEGESAASSYANTPQHKRYIGYGRLNPAPDILPVDRVLLKHSDNQSEMDTWVSTASSDPMYLWAGYFDTSTGKIVRESIGRIIVITPPKPVVIPPAQPSGGHAVAVGMGLVGAIGILALASKH